MGRAYVVYGPPDQIEDRNGTQIWRYVFLPSFGSNVEFEFTPANPRTGMRIKWPPALAVCEGSADTTITMGRGGENRAVEGGLPGHHASFQIYPSGEFQSFAIPLESLTGAVEITVQIRQALNARPVAALRDNANASEGTYRANFILNPGSYVCSLLVTEEASGKTYGETIHFEVK
jgi:hypothetical protein